MRRFKNQAGFTLVETLIAVAILGGVSLLTMKLVQDQTTNQAYLKAMSEVNKTTSLIEGYLNNPTRCQEMLENALVSATGTPLGDPEQKDVSLLGFTHPTAVPATRINILGENNYGDFSIPNDGIVLKTSSFGAAVTDIEIRYQINVAGSARGRDSSGSITVTKVIPLVVSLVAGRIVSCGPALTDNNLTALEQMCNDLGQAARWDSVAQQCRFKPVACGPNEVVTKMTKFGTYECGALTDQIGPVLDDYFDTTPVDCSGKKTFSIIRSGDKYKINCI